MTNLKLVRVYQTIRLELVIIQDSSGLGFVHHGLVHQVITHGSKMHLHLLPIIITDHSDRTVILNP